MIRTCAFLLLVLQSAAAGELADAVQQVADGEVLFEFDAREGVCGDGHNITIRSRDRFDDTWGCDGEIVRVLLRIEHGEVETLKYKVGSRRSFGSGAQLLGSIDPNEAAAYLLSLGQEAKGSIAKDAIAAAALARDAIVWPQLLEIARDARRPEPAREAALFWLGQEAGEKAASGLEEFVDSDDEDLELREHAIFALSQMDSEHSVPKLIEIARHNPSGRLRKSALFWLAQSEDERALQLFAEILEAD